jgi:hypothetical protein
MDKPAGGGGGPKASASRPSSSASRQVQFSVLASSSADEAQDQEAYRQEARRWKIAALTLGLLLLGATLLATQASSAARSFAPSVGARLTVRRPPPSSSADHQALVTELGLNATQALLLDASRMRAFLRSDAWREERQRRQRRRRAAETASSSSSSSSSSSLSRGIVIPAGGRDHLLNALVLVRHLRAVGCALPIEVVHFGPEEVGAGDSGGPEASSARKAAALLAREPNVRLVDAHDVDEDDEYDAAAATAATASASESAQAEQLPHHRPSVPASFGKKVWSAAYAASFRHILLLDGDSLPLIDPEPLFDAPDYKRAGSMFWPDFWHDAWTDASLWRALGVVPPWQREEADQEEDRDEGAAVVGSAAASQQQQQQQDQQPHHPLQRRRWRHRLLESGQLLVDRERHADALEWAWLLNGPNREVVYKAMHGDKDTWRLAFDLAGKGGGGRKEGGGGDEGKSGNGVESGDNDDDNNDQTTTGGFFFMVPHKARDVMREGPPGHAHRWHHVGVLQAAPRGVPSVLRAAKEAAVGAGSNSSSNNITSSTTLAALRQAASQAFDTAIAANSSDASGGWPFFLHRTSFNAKFFPDCARRPDADKEEEQAAPGGNGTTPAALRRFPYCRPTHSSVPLADEQAARALKPHMYAFDDADVAADAAARRCALRLAAAAGRGGGASAAAAADSPLVAPLLFGGRLPERACTPEGLAKRGELPVPTFQIDLAWPYVSRAVDQSGALYRQARKEAWEA